MTTDHAAFLKDIIANPDADLPRLVYADWLEERGEGDRAEFIRVQCELAKPGGDKLCSAPSNHGYCDCRTVALRRRERELLAHIGISLVPRITSWVGFYNPGMGQYGWIALEPQHPSRFVSVEFRRGFVSEITLSWDDWQRHADDLLAACPIRNAKGGLVRLTTWPGIVVGSNPAVSNQEWLMSFCAREWPGVRLELPDTRCTRCGHELYTSEVYHPDSGLITPSRRYCPRCDLPRRNVQDPLITRRATSV